MGCPGILYNFQLCGGYSLLSDWPASVGKSLLIVPLLTYTTQVNKYSGHTSLNPGQIISACLGSGLPHRPLVTTLHLCRKRVGDALIHTMCISDTPREHHLSRGPRAGSRHPCIGLDTHGGIDTPRRAIPRPSTCPPSCLHNVSVAPELVGDADDALPLAITMVISRDRHCPDIANISTHCANIEISCTTSVPRPIKFHGTCLTATLLNSQSSRNKVDLIDEADHDIDNLALRETWLTNTPEDEYYTKELSFSGYKLINVPHLGGGGHSGGVAIIHKDGLSAQTVATTGAGYTTFEHCDVQFTNNSGFLNIIVVYHPPPKKRNGHTVGAFPDEFRSLLEDRMSSLGASCDLLLTPMLRSSWTYVTS